MDTLLEQLLRDGHITEDQVRVVTIECAITNALPSSVLLQNEFVSTDVLSKYNNNSLSVSLDAVDFVPDENALALVDEQLARRHCALPLSFTKESKLLIVALDDISNVVARDVVRRGVDKTVMLEFRQSSTSDIKQILDKCYGQSHSLATVLSEIDQQPAAYVAQNDQLNAPVIRLIDTLLHDATLRRASDVHLSPEASHMLVRFRIDGVLRNILCLHIRYWPAMLVRIKVLSNLDIAETRQAQDGHLTRFINGTHIDFRVSSFPLSSGENLVLRVLDRRSGLLGLDAICRNRRTEKALQAMIARPSGLVLVCGPTGSGKTTTLYALLRSLDADSLNIMTLEDPVEYPIPSIRQTRINGNSAIGFAEGVRGVLRQDPDVILVGEVRDADSCSMSCRAAMTGHLVLTSTHASSCINAIGRLLELGVTRSVLASVLSGIVSQRLIRKTCAQCEGADGQCRACFGSGYTGRIALFECLSVSDMFSDHLHSGASLAELRQYAVDEGLVPLIQQAQGLVKEKQTTRQEIIRIFGGDENDHAM